MKLQNEMTVECAWKKALNIFMGGGFKSMNVKESEREKCGPRRRGEQLDGLRPVL